MILILYIILWIGAVGSLFLGLKERMWLLTMLAFILFFVLAMQGTNIEMV